MSINKQLGFTLLEIIVVTIIIVILSSISLISYKKIVNNNNRQLVKTKLLSFATDLTNEYQISLDYRNYLNNTKENFPIYYHGYTINFEKLAKNSFIIVASKLKEKISLNQLGEGKLYNSNKNNQNNYENW